MYPATRSAALCKECRGELVYDPENGENACRMCGVVDSTAPEAVSLPFDQSMSDRSQPESRLAYDLQLHTLIGGQNTDANGRRISPEGGFDQLRRLNNITISRSSRTSNELKASFEISRITDNLKLPSSVRTHAQEIYRKGLGAGIVSGKSIANMSAATVMIAASTVGVPCSADDIANATESVSARTTRRYYKLLIRGLNLELDRTNPTKHVSGIAGRAGLSTRVERRAVEILGTVSGSPTLTDKRPISLAGAALYLASIEVGEHINQLKLAYAAGITPITIRKRSTEISTILNSAKEAKEFLEELRSEEREAPGEEMGPTAIPAEAPHADLELSL